MAAVDKDNNGRISFDEYVDYFEKLWTQKEEKHRKTRSALWHTDKRTDRQTNNQTEEQTDIHTG